MPNSLWPAIIAAIATIANGIIIAYGTKQFRSGEEVSRGFSGCMMSSTVLLFTPLNILIGLVIIGILTASPETAREPFQDHQNNRSESNTYLISFAKNGISAFRDYKFQVRSAKGRPPGDYSVELNEFYLAAFSIESLQGDQLLQVRGVILGSNDVSDSSSNELGCKTEVRFHEQKYFIEEYNETAMAVVVISDLPDRVCSIIR